MANNLVWGWAMVLAGLASGVALMPVFLNDAWGGGYASARRRFLRLGHVACVALGILNILAAHGGGPFNLPLAAGGAGMAAGCLAAAFFDRVKFVLPVFAALLIWGCVAVLRGIA